MKNEILKRRLELLEEVEKLDIVIKEEYEQLIKLPKKTVLYELGDNEGGINKRIRKVEQLIIDMGDEYIDDETIDPVLMAQQVLRKYRDLKSEVIDYLLTNY